MDSLAQLLKSSQLSNSVQVIARIKPILDSDNDKESCLDYDADTITVIRSKDKIPTSFTFDKVISPTSSKLDIFALTSQLANAWESGHNAIFIVNGQSSSGKTFTMQEQLPLLFKHIFSHKQRQPITASFLEFYKGDLYDLANAKTTKLCIQESNKSINVPELTMTPITSASALLMLYDRVSRLRTTSATRMNPRSSRSHFCTTLYCGGARLNLVDLAGCERMDRQATRAQLNEAGVINEEIANLGKCISALTRREGRHVPFRSYKLTQFLSPSLRGKAKVLVCCNVSRLKRNVGVTMSTLMFGAEARVKENGVEAMVRKLVKRNGELVAEIERLKDEASDGSSVKGKEEVNEMKRLVVEGKREREELEVQVMVEKEKSEFLEGVIDRLARFAVGDGQGDKENWPEVYRGREIVESREIVFKHLRQRNELRGCCQKIKKAVDSNTDVVNHLLGEKVYE